MESTVKRRTALRSFPVLLALLLALVAPLSAPTTSAAVEATVGHTAHHATTSTVTDSAEAHHATADELPACARTPKVDQRPAHAVRALRAQNVAGATASRAPPATA